MAIKSYSTTPASNTALFPEGMAPSSVNDSARQVQADVRSWYEDAEWTDLGDVPTQMAAAKFSVPGNKVSTYTVNRRIKAFDASTLYGYVSEVSLSTSVTNITVVLDSGSLTSSLSSFAVSILKPSNFSIPNDYKQNAVLQNGAAIYAADSVGTDAYAITLSPAISAYTTGMVVNFKAGTANTGACTLAVNGLSAITIKKNHDQDLATGDIESGQIVTVVYDGTNFQMQSQVASSVAQDYELISTATASSSASIEFTDLSSTYFAYKVIIDNVAPATDTVTLWMRVSDDNGSSYYAGASDYAWAGTELVLAAPSATESYLSDNEDAQILIHNNFGNGANETGNVIIDIVNPSSTTFHYITYAGGQRNLTPDSIGFSGYGCRSTAIAIDAIQFLFSSGNIATGTFKLYGIRAS